MANSVQIVVQGDSYVGKTSLYIRHYSNTFITPYIPSMFDNQVKEIMLNGSPVSISYLEVPHGGERHDVQRFWHMIYVYADVCLLCFSLTDPYSYENIVNEYFPDFIKCCPTTPIVLVGTKHDLVNDQETIKRLRTQKLSPLTTADGIKLAKEINAVTYMECSALTGKGVNEIFEKGALAGLNYKMKKD